MTAHIINEGVFQAIFDSVGMGTTWKVLKGRFWTAFRSWGTVIDIWRADTKEDLKKVLEKSESDIAEIKGRYRAAETQYAKENGLFNSSFGDSLIFFHPGMAIGAALAEPLLDEAYRADTRRLMKYTGLTDWGLTPEFVNNWIEDESKIEKQTARATVAGPDGQSQTIDIFSYTDKNDETQNALNALHGLFITESTYPDVIREGPEGSKTPYGKKEVEKMTDLIISAYESQGILANMQEVGRQIKERKEQVINDVVIPSAQTLSLLSEMLSSSTVENFISSMQALSKINVSLKGLNPGDFKTNIKSAAEQIVNNEDLYNQIKSDLKKEELTEDDIEQLTFVNARNEFAKNVILTLETVYEENVDVLMDGITDKGLAAMKETAVGKEYAELIQNNIQLLENAIKSLNDLAKKGV